MVGWLGSDSFAFTTAMGADNVDLIRGFSSADDTTLPGDAVFRQIEEPGALAANAFHIGSSAQDGDDRIICDANSGQLFYDADGAGALAPILFATLSGAPTTNATDFLVI